MRRWGCAAAARGTAAAKAAVVAMVAAAVLAMMASGWAAPAPTARDAGRVVDGRGTASSSRPGRGSLGAPPRAGRPAQVVSTAAQRKSVTVTVYSNGLALVQERRRVTLPAGAVVLRYQDVPAALLADSVRLRVRPSGVAQLEQQAFHPATLTPAALLKAYQGKTVTLIQTRRVGGRMQRMKVQEKLVADSGGQIWEVNGHYVVHGPGGLPAFEAPRLPADLFAQPTLVWRLHSRRHGAVTIVTRYLTSGLDWHAAYALTLAAGGASGELSAALAVENRSGVAYRDARLRLVAGQVNSAPPLVFPVGVMAVQAAPAAAPPSVGAQRAYAYRLFIVRRPVSLAPQGETQAPWLRAVRVPVHRRYVVQGGAAFFGPMQTAGAVEREPVAVELRIANTAAAGLGRALPGGVVRVYGPVGGNAGKGPGGGKTTGPAGPGGDVFLGADTLPNTAAGGTVRLRLGQAFDLRARRTLAAFHVIAPRQFRATYRIRVRNGGPRAERVRDDETLRGDWTLLHASQPFTRPNAQTARFELRVPAGGAATVSYTVEEKY
jgi:hypothetical protein